MLSSNLAAVLQQAAPSFTTRVRWAIEEGDSVGLRDLSEEDPSAFAAFLAQQRSDVDAQEAAAEERRSIALALGRQRREANLLQSKASVTDEMRAAIIAGTLPRTEALLAVLDWLEQRPTPWLILSGRPGSGKSVAPAAALAEHGGLWITSNELVQVFASLFGEAALAQQRVKEAPLLVIDELGVEDDAPRAAAALLQVLNARNSASRTPVICTTPLTFDALAKRFANDRVRSRFNELVSWVPVSAANLRPLRPQLFIPTQESAS